MTDAVRAYKSSRRALGLGQKQHFELGGPVTLAFLAALELFVVAPAHAQSAGSASTQARVLFREARKLMDKGQFDDACPKLEESLRLDDGMGTRFNLAHCLEKTGRTASAWGLFLDVASAASTVGQKKREKAARQRAEALEPKLEALRAGWKAPGLAVGLVVDGELVWFKGFGERRVAPGAPVDQDTLFRIASMSKAFVSAAVLRLRDEGKLALDEPAERYLPELARLGGPTADSPRLTVRHLLSHAGGLPEDNATADLRMPMAEAEFDVVLMDCQMPVMDGLACTRALRERETRLQLRRLPVVAMTAASDEDARDECRDAGMDDFLTKPVDQLQFAAVLARVMRATTP